MDIPSGAQILLAIRQGHINDWRSACSYFRFDPTERNTATFLIAEALQKLERQRLIKVDGSFDPSSFHFPKGNISLSEEAMLFNDALGVSMSEAAKHKNGYTMTVTPLFGIHKEHEIDVFVVMPFSDNFTLIYDDHLVNVANKINISIMRADDFFSVHEIMRDVWSSIQGAKIIIAECTGRNPNVFYEIGIAHTLGKPVILITQNDDDVPSDLKHIRYIKYKYTPRGMAKFESPEKSLQPVEFIGLYFSAKKGVFANNFNMLREFSPDFFQGTQI